MAYKGGKRNKAQLTYDRDLYYYSTLKIAQPLSEQEAKKEYSRLRSIARKRLERFEGTEWTDTQIYKYNKNNFPTIANIKNIDELYRRLDMIARFLSSKRGSVSGLKQERKANIETLHEHKYSFVNVKNFRKFADFMEATRMEAQKFLYDSNRVAELFRVGEKKKIDPTELEKDFASWMNNLEKLKKMKPITNKNKVSANAYRKALGIKNPE